MTRAVPITEQTAVSIKGLSKEYRTIDAARTVLHDVNVTFPKGRLSLIIGKNGSGKSTLLTCIAGLTAFDSGTIDVTNDDVRYSLCHGKLRFISTDVRRKLGVIFQQKALWPYLTVLDNITHPLRKVHNKTKDHARQIAERCLADTGLKSLHFARYPHQLSGGEQRKVAVARALAIEADLLLVDELEANLDQAAIEVVCRLIKKKFIDQKKTILLVSHRIDLFERYAPYIILLEEGKVIEAADNLDKLLANEKRSGETNKFIRDVIDPARTQWYFGNQCLRTAREISKLSSEAAHDTEFSEEDVLCQLGEQVFSLLNQLEPDESHLFLIITRDNEANLRIRSAECRNLTLNGKDASKLGESIVERVEILRDGRIVYKLKDDHRETVKARDCILKGGNSLIRSMFVKGLKGIEYQASDYHEKIPGAKHISLPLPEEGAPYIELSRETKNVYLISITEDDEVRGVISIDTTSRTKWSNLIVEQLVVIANMTAVAIKATGRRT